MLEALEMKPDDFTVLPDGRIQLTDKTILEGDPSYWAHFKRHFPKVLDLAQHNAVAYRAVHAAAIEQLEAVRIDVRHERDLIELNRLLGELHDSLRGEGGRFNLGITLAQLRTLGAFQLSTDALPSVANLQHAVTFDTPLVTIRVCFESEQLSTVWVLPLKDGKRLHDFALGFLIRVPSDAGHALPVPRKDAGARRRGGSDSPRATRPRARRTLLGLACSHSHT